MATDNLSIHGIEDDDPPRRGKKNRGRKGFVLQARSIAGPGYVPTSGLHWLWKSLQNWYTHSRYHTESARDQAYTALVKRAAVTGWMNADGELYRITEYRKL